MYKCFDEGAVNARDHWVRLSEKKGVKFPVTKIDFNVDIKTGIITILNDGEGIDIVKHKTHNIFVPSLIFGELLTSSNYDKSEKKVYSKAGEVVIFPGWLVHHVPENKGEGRSVISGNLSYE